MDIKYRIFDRDRGSWKLTWKMRNLFFFGGMIGSKFWLSFCLK